MPKIRVGIDVGGTFTHAVAIDDSNLRLIGQAKVMTTHNDRIGVARGVINSLKILLKKANILKNNISLVAHSTTQATNALLEGDVAPVGVIGIGSGLSGCFVKMAINIAQIKLWNNKTIKVYRKFYDIGSGIDQNRLTELISGLKAQGIGSLVVAEAFSTENSENERAISEIALKLGIPCTATSDISGLYGLRVRTKTAIINASILPKMLNAAQETEKAVRALKIKAPIMVVRSDGGILSLDEMKKRPILTILSGPAAGVGAALFYEKMSEGIFIEVGGTSTDISTVKGGISQIRPAVLGRHRIHLKTLDVKTLGIAGGSLSRFHNGRLFDVGPRSAHIAGINYASFSDIGKRELKIKFMRPKQEDDNDHLSLSDGNKLYALTPTCAANYLGLISPSDWAYGNQRSIKMAFEFAGKGLSIKPSELAGSILDIASDKIMEAVKGFIKDYGLDKAGVRLIGGGGAAATLVPYLAKKMGLKYKLAKDQAVISAIGAAMSMVHEEVERSVPFPNDEDILAVKLEAQNKVISMGALPGTVQVNMFIDRRKNIVRASAFGSLKSEQRKEKNLTIDQLKKVLVKENIKKSDIKMCGRIGEYFIFRVRKVKSFLFLSREQKELYILDLKGVIRQKIADALCKISSPFRIIDNLEEIIGRYKKYSDSGVIIPKIMIVFPDKIMDLSTIYDIDLMKSLIDTEIGIKTSGHNVALIWKLM